MQIKTTQNIPQIVIHPQGSNAPKPSQPREAKGLWGADGFGFGDLIDILNPLQHIPVVSTLYRAITGDKISNGARIGGGVLLGGVVGLAVGVIDSTLVHKTGKDMGDTALTALGAENPDGTLKVAKRSNPTHLSPYQQRNLSLYAQAQILNKQDIVV